MNLITFKGRTTIIRGLAAWFLSPAPALPPLPEELVAGLGELAADEEVDAGVLGRVAGFLAANGTPHATIKRMAENDPGRLVRLARDVEAIDRRLADGAISSVRVVEECGD